MKINITFDVSDYDREVVNTFYGDPGKANYKTMRHFITNTVEAELETQGFNLEQRERGAEERIEREEAEAREPDGNEIVGGEAEWSNP